MTRQETIHFLRCAAVGFTVAHGLLFLLFVTNTELYQHISLHYAESLTWYAVFFLVPMFAGLGAYLWLRDKALSNGLRILMGTILVLQIAFTGMAVSVNWNYWGYPFRRPTVFREIHEAAMVLTCSKVANVDATGIHPLRVVTDTTHSVDNLYGRRDPYYGNLDRIFMVFQDNAPVSPHLYDVPEVYRNPRMKASPQLLQALEQQINASNLLDKGQENWDRQGTLNGVVTEFVTEGNERYAFAGLKGGEVANDHYPFYEFLFVERSQQYELVKKQRFYIDVAGIEGLEYANVAPFFSFILTIIALLAAGIIALINRIALRRS